MSVSRRKMLVGIVFALGCAGLWAWLAPAERSLGDRIRLVYLHVSATWAGLLFLYGTALGGLVRFSGVGRPLDPWFRRTWTAGVALFGLGFALSLVAAKVSWGGVFWGEPRVRASLGAVGWAVVSLAVEAALGSSRLRTLVWPAGAVAVTVVLARSARILHPEDPIQDVTPLGIRLTFYGITLLMLCVGALSAAALPADSPPNDPSPARVNDLT